VYLLFAFVILMPIGMFLVQRQIKKLLAKDQYYYIKDLLFVGVWAVAALWLKGEGLLPVVALGVLGASLGMFQKYFPSRWWVLSYFLIGFMFALLGLKIEFIRFAGREYVYFQWWMSLIVTSLWVGLYPLLIQELDRIPGLAGFLLAVTWSLMLLVTGFSGQNLGGAFQMSLLAVFILGVFWSRHGHAYRRLGEPLAAMWGILIAGTSILGVSKGVTFSTMMMLPLGLFAVPIVEKSLHFISLALDVNRESTVSLYRKFLDKGYEHATAVKLVGLISAALGMTVAAIQMRGQNDVFMLLGLITPGALLGYGWLTLRRKHKSLTSERRPKLWGIPIDNVSSDYAVSKVVNWIRLKQGGKYIVTLDALATLRARKDKIYAKCVKDADLVLPDGKGLTFALRFLGMPVQERIAGIDFVEKMCRIAAYEKVSVYFLGGAEGIAAKAAENMAKKYQGLEIAGVHHGYFDETEEPKIIEHIRESGASFLLVALGVPKQEIWMNRHREELEGIVAIGVGGSFDVLSGKLRRAPLIWQRLGLEWLFRLIQEPWRWRRVKALPLFGILVLLTKLGFDRGWYEDGN